MRSDSSHSSPFRSYGPLDRMARKCVLSFSRTCSTWEEDHNEWTWKSEATHTAHSTHSAVQSAMEKITKKKKIRKNAAPKTQNWIFIPRSVFRVCFFFILLSVHCLSFPCAFCLFALCSQFSCAILAHYHGAHKKSTNTLTHSLIRSLAQTLTRSEGGVGAVRKRYIARGGERIKLVCGGYSWFMYCSKFVFINYFNPIEFLLIFCFSFLHALVFLICWGWVFFCPLIFFTLIRNRSLK